MSKVLDLSVYVASEWWADRTNGEKLVIANGSPEWEDRVVWAAIGASEEAGEVAGEVLSDDHDKLLAESGDVVHYLIAMASLTGCLLPDASDIATHGRQPPVGPWAESLRLCRDASSVLGFVKKARFYKKDPNAKLQLGGNFFSALKRTHLQLATTLLDYDLTIEDAAAHNHEKMLKRFPTGWNAADAKAKKDEHG